MSSQQLQLPCLGRPFSLGMLYDCHSDRPIPGRTLWDSKLLESSYKKEPDNQPSTNVEVLVEDSIHAKTSSLDIDARLKLSFLGGLVKVGGAAKFLDDKRTSGRQARVTLRHTSTSRFEHLSMEQLANIQHPQVLDTTQATHVVSGITYGADAFFVFDRSIEESEEMRKVHGDMEAKIKFIHVGGSASLNIKENEKSETESFKCKFFGDVELPLYPSTFKEAVEVYRDLPRLLKELCQSVCTFNRCQSSRERRMWRSAPSHTT